MPVTPEDVERDRLRTVKRLEAAAGSLACGGMSRDGIMAIVAAALDQVDQENRDRQARHAARLEADRSNRPEVSDAVAEFLRLTGVT